MRNIMFVILMIPLLCVMNCGRDIQVKKGDRFEVLIDLREAAEVQGREEDTDGFQCNIPRRAILEAMYNHTKGAHFFKCRVIQVNGNTNEDYILETLAPDALRKRVGFETFSVTLPVGYIGLKIKKTSR